VRDNNPTEEQMSRTVYFFIIMITNILTTLLALRIQTDTGINTLALVVLIVWIGAFVVNAIVSWWRYW
jgi:hypothetical protein